MCVCVCCVYVCVVCVYVCMCVVEVKDIQHTVLASNLFIVWEVNFKCEKRLIFDRELFRDKYYILQYRQRELVGYSKRWILYKREEREKTVTSVGASVLQLLSLPIKILSLDNSVVYFIRLFSRILQVRRLHIERRCEFSVALNIFNVKGKCKALP